IGRTTKIWAIAPGGCSPMEETMRQRRSRREFTDAYRAEVVALCQKRDRSIAQVARDLDLTETSVRRWVAQAEVDAGRKPGITSGEQAEMARLRRENRVLREERDICQASRFFLRDGRSITMYRFIEAEREEEHSINRACAVLEVSRAAYYEWSKQEPSL